MGLRAVCMPYFGGACLTQVLAVLWGGTTIPMKGSQFLDAAGRRPARLAHANRSGHAGGCANAHAHGPRQSRLATVRLCALGGGPAGRGAGSRAAARRPAPRRQAAQRADRRRRPAAAGRFQRRPLRRPATARRQRRRHPGLCLLPSTSAALLDPAPDLVRLVDQRADIYSLGLVLYEMLTGHRPFAAGSNYLFSANTLSAMVEERSRVVPSLRSSRPDLPWSLESILCKCLDPAPERRYPRAEHLADDLRRFVDDRPLRFAPEPSWRERTAKWLRRHPRLTSSGSVAVVAAALLATAGTALVGVHRHLVGAEEQLHATQVDERRRQFEAATVRALCLVNTVADGDDPLPRGRAVCERALGAVRRPRRRRLATAAGMAAAWPSRAAAAGRAGPRVAAASGVGAGSHGAGRPGSAAGGSACSTGRPGWPACRRRRPCGATALTTWKRSATPTGHGRRAHARRRRRRSAPRTITCLPRRTRAPAARPGCAAPWPSWTGPWR